MRISLKKNKILIIIIGLLILIGLNFYQKEVRGFFYALSSPLQKMFWQKGQKVSNFFEAIFQMANLKKGTDDLEFKNQQLLSEIAYLKELEKENKALREALGVGLKEEFKLADAEIIGKDLTEDFILINKGSKEGVTEGLPVITQSKVLLGKISEVYENFSKVMLISNKKSSLNVKIQDKEIQGVLKGKGNLSLSFGLIPQDKEIEKEDLIITTSAGGNFPKGLLVGKVDNIRKSDVKPLQEAEILPFFDLSQLETIFVILDF